MISIHTPRAGSDDDAAAMTAKATTISIHTPRAGSDLACSSGVLNSTLFQSTLPVRGVTSLLWHPCIDDSRISIHTPRAGSDEHFERG